MYRNQTRQKKIKLLFDRELEQNPNKIKEYKSNQLNENVAKLQQFWFPRIMIEKQIEGLESVYSIYETNSDIYYPLEDKYIELCIEHGVMTMSRTLRIFKKKKTLKKLLKQKSRSEDCELQIQSLNETIQKIYKSGNTINLNLLR